MRSIVIFVKAPAPGFAKTRLTPALSPEQAAHLSHMMARDTLDTAAKVSGARVWVAYQPHPHWPEPHWLLNISKSPWFFQEGRDLGERLAAASAKVLAEDGGPVVLVGSDLPGLTPALIEKAFGLLTAAPVALGPAEDGGYYLIGLRAPAPVLFKGIEWSAPSVLAQTITRVQAARLEYKLLPRRRDLDTVEDLEHVRKDPALLSLDFRRTLTFLKDL